MATFTSNKGLAIPTVQGDIGLWGTELNLNPPILDGCLGGTSTINMAGGSNVTLTTVQSQNLILNLTGALTANVALILPQLGAFFIVQNNTTGNFVVTVQTSAIGLTVGVAQGDRVMLASDGTNVVYATKAGWREIAVYTPASVGSFSFLLPAPFRRFRFTLQQLVLTASTNLVAQVSINGGASFISSAAYINVDILAQGSSISVTSPGPVTTIPVTGVLSVTPSSQWDATYEIFPGNTSSFCMMRWNGFGFNSSNAWTSYSQGSVVNAGGAVNALSIGAVSGTFSGTIILEGLP